MNSNRSVLRSFAHAFEGLFYAVRHERNLRFHITIALLITLFAYAYGLTRIEWGVLFSAIMLVVLSELANTAVERAVDTACTDYHPMAKAAKDVGAAIPLAASGGALITGCVLFLDFDKINNALRILFTTPHLFVVGAVLVIGGTVFVAFGGIKDERKRDVDAKG